MNTRDLRKILISVVVAVAIPFVVSVFVSYRNRSDVRDDVTGRRDAVATESTTAVVPAADTALIAEASTQSPPQSPPSPPPPSTSSSEPAPEPVPEPAAENREPIKTAAAVKRTPLTLTGAALTESVHDYLGGLTDAVSPVREDARAIADLVETKLPPVAELVTPSNSLCQTAALADVAGMADYAAGQPVAGSAFAATTVRLTTSAAALSAFCEEFDATTTNDAALTAIRYGVPAYDQSLAEVAAALKEDYAALAKDADVEETRTTYEEAVNLLE
jgi:hypothetical protein